MALTYGFYDSLTGDRVYNALQFSSLLDSIINDGVFMSIGDALFVEDGSGLHVMVNTGRAWFEHTWTYNDAQLTLNITTPHAVLARIDTVVLETNSDSGTRANSIKVIAGTPASSPVPPTLTHTATIHQHPLADVYVDHEVTEINQADITNRIGTSDCPFVTGILESTDIDFLFAQWQDDFETWFLYLQDQLDDNQAANLLAEIMEHDHSNPVHTKVVTAGIADEAVTLLKLLSSLRFQKLFEFAANGSSHFDWTSIPQTFTHLILIWSGLSTRVTSGWDDIFVRVNNDSGNTYYTSLWVRDYMGERWQWGITNPHNKGLYCGVLPTTSAGLLESGAGFMFIGNYKGTVLYKSSVALNYFNGSSHGLSLSGGQWRSAAAINRLTSYMAGTDYPRVGSLFSLYGFN
jgi:hypothetical protein